eukprot:3559209-Ditylum_brightwellii.AAC.1
MSSTTEDAYKGDERESSQDVPDVVGASWSSINTKEDDSEACSVTPQMTLISEEVEAASQSSSWYEDDSGSASTEDHDAGVEKARSGDEDPYADVRERMEELADRDRMNH